MKKCTIISIAITTYSMSYISEVTNIYAIGKHAVVAIKKSSLASLTKRIKSDTLFRKQ